MGGLLGVLILAWIAPFPGSPLSPLPIPLLKKTGIFLIFFTQGVLLPGEEIKKGVKDWPLHLLVQCSIFLMLPLLAAGLLWTSSGFFHHPDLRMGFLFLSFLPTTISSAVGLTTLARGNVTGALFNCSLGAVLGSFLVPVYCLKWLQTGSGDSGINLTGTLSGISLILLLPLILGQLLRSRLGSAFTRHKNALSRMTLGVILFIVWTAFCSSFQQQVWLKVPPSDLIVCFLGSSLLLGLASSLVWLLSGWVRMDLPSRITAFFCGSQKALSVGLPLSVLMFGSGNPTVDLSLLVIPLLIYHPSQLLLGGWLVPKFAKRVQTHPPKPSEGNLLV